MEETLVLSRKIFKLGDCNKHTKRTFVNSYLVQVAIDSSKTVIIQDFIPGFICLHKFTCTSYRTKSLRKWHQLCVWWDVLSLGLYSQSMLLWLRFGLHCGKSHETFYHEHQWDNFKRSKWELVTIWQEN